MKILNITPMYFPVNRGGERHVQEVSERLASRGHEVTVVTTTAKSGQDLWDGIGGALQDFESINGVGVVRVPITESVFARMLDFWPRLKGGYRSLNYFFTSAEQEVLRRPPRNLGFFRSILRSDADLVVSWNWYWPPAYHAYLARSLKRFRLVGMPFFHTAESWARQPLYDRMIAACDALGVNTAYEKEFVLERVPTMDNIAVVGAGVDPERFTHRDGRAFRTRYALGCKPLVGFVGSMGPNKGVDKIVEAMSMVWSWNEDVYLVLAGFRDSQFAALDQVLQRLGPCERERVLMLPDFAESEKADLYDALDAFVMPSTGESFGISYLEAWMCRKPVIGSRIGSTACVIEEGADGLLVEPNDPSDIGRAIIELLGDPDRCSRMGERGYAKTVEHFTWEKVCDRAERFFLEVIAGTPRPRLCQWRRKASLSSPM
jgi:glycosyltransferase involved in cell wall biosynthesis